MLDGITPEGDPMTKKTLRIKQVAQHVDIPLRTLHRMLIDGRFPVDPIPDTKPRIWYTDAVDAWLKGQNKCKT